MSLVSAFNLVYHLALVLVPSLRALCLVAGSGLPWKEVRGFVAQSNYSDWLVVMLVIIKTSLTKCGFSNGEPSVLGGSTGPAKKATPFSSKTI